MLYTQKPQQDITTQLEQGRILPLVFRLTIPAVIVQLITFLYNIVDRMYVARIDGSGMDALAALGIITAIVIFKTFPKIFRERERVVKEKMQNKNG